MTYKVQVGWGPFKAGQVVSAGDLAGCNMAMLLARGVLVPVVPKKATRTPVRPVKPKEL